MDFFSVRENNLTLSEASLEIMTDLEDYPVAKQAKKLRLKAKLLRGKGDGKAGPDAAILTGREQDIVKYAQEYLGFDGKTWNELLKAKKAGDI